MVTLSQGGTSVVVVVDVVVLVVLVVLVVVVSPDVGSGIESGPSPGVHAAANITPTIAKAFQRTLAIVPEDQSGSSLKTLV